MEKRSSESEPELANGHSWSQNFEVGAGAFYFKAEQFLIKS